MLKSEGFLGFLIESHCDIYLYYIILYYRTHVSLNHYCVYAFIVFNRFTHFKVILSNTCKIFQYDALV